jgi:hypothetical protein
MPKRHRHPRFYPIYRLKEQAACQSCPLFTSGAGRGEATGDGGGAVNQKRRSSLPGAGKKTKISAKFQLGA